MKTASSLFFLLISLLAFGQNEPVTTKGQIKDNTGAPIPFAAIFQQKTNKGTYADSLGNFTMTTKMGDTLAISAIGFGGNKFVVNGKTGIVINLKKETNSLADVKVTANNRQQNANEGQPTTIEKEVIGNTISDYKLNEQLFNGTVSMYVSPRGGGMPKSSADYELSISTKAIDMAKYYHGSLLPVFTHTDATQGSPYLFPTWAKGYVVNTSGIKVANDSYSFNFDKLSQNLLMTQDKKNTIEVDRAIIQSFYLNTDGKEYVFEKRIIGNDQKLLQVLAKGTKYILYKTTITKFERANYVNSGLTESGHNYDLYVDKPAYYIYVPATNQLKQFDLKKKAIKEAFPQDQTKVDAYFSQHTDGVNEEFLIGLVNSLN